MFAPSLDFPETHKQEYGILVVADCFYLLQRLEDLIAATVRVDFQKNVFVDKVIAFIARVAADQISLVANCKTLLGGFIDLFGQRGES